jgi:hypothetical protein
LSGASPIAAATTGGPATNSWPLPRTITEKCEATTRAAPRPATGPSAAATTGTIARLSIATSIHEPRERQSQVVRHPLGVDHLLPDRRVGRAAADREVVGLDHQPAPVRLALPDDHVRGHERVELPVLAVAGDAAGGVLALHARGAVRVRRGVAGERLAAAQLLELRFPGHGRAACQVEGPASVTSPAPCSRSHASSSSPASGRGDSGVPTSAPS